MINTLMSDRITEDLRLFLKYFDFGLDIAIFYDKDGKDFCRKYISLNVRPHDRQELKSKLLKEIQILKPSAKSVEIIRLKNIC